jgi:phosphatidylinositol kinase/protein kinase (PI-3  family)
MNSKNHGSDKIMEPEELLNEDKNNEIPKKESPLVSLEPDLKFFNESIREVANEIMVEGLSNHPIFIAHQHELKLGELILDRHDLNTEWSIHASTLEEFVEKGVIKEILKERFISSYKNPYDFMCVFVVVPEGANFIYFPYVKD